MNIRHKETSRDSLYQDLSMNLQMVYELWLGGDNKGPKQLRFIIPLLCAIKLEAFINIAGKYNVIGWDLLERKLGFKEKCLIICEITGHTFDEVEEPNKSAISIFETRNAIVHPKMKLHEIDELISHEEYEARSSQMIIIDHHLRSTLNEQAVKLMKEKTDVFIETWKGKFLDYPDYWLSGGSTGSYTLEDN